MSEHFAEIKNAIVNYWKQNWKDLKWVEGRRQEKNGCHATHNGSEDRQRKEGRGRVGGVGHAIQNESEVCREKMVGEGVVLWPVGHAVQNGPSGGQREEGRGRVSGVGCAA